MIREDGAMELINIGLMISIGGFTFIRSINTIDYISK